MTTTTALRWQTVERLAAAVCGAYAEPMPMRDDLVHYGRLRLHGLSAEGLHRAPDWKLVRAIDPERLERIRAACERLDADKAGYLLLLLDKAVQGERDSTSERWADELIALAEGRSVEGGSAASGKGTLLRRVRRRR